MHNDQLAELVNRRRQLDRDKTYYLALRALSDDPQFKLYKKTKQNRVDDLTNGLKVIDPENALEIARTQAKVRVHEAEIREMEQFIEIIEGLDSELKKVNSEINRLTTK